MNNKINKIILICLVITVSLFCIEKQKNINLIKNTAQDARLNSRLIADESAKSIASPSIKKVNHIVSTKNKELFDLILDKVRYEYVEEGRRVKDRNI